MSAFIIRPEEEKDREVIHMLLVGAFEGKAEAGLVDALRHAGDVVLSLVAERDGDVRGHILFSRLIVRRDQKSFPALALAPLAVDQDHRREGIGGALVEEAHMRLQQAGELLSFVLGEPSFYGRFGYAHERARGFESAYQGPYLQAVAWGEAPRTGRLDYAAAFAELG